ncbi:MAG TPA: choice-of-anchor tandem repeat GloVer-containing protein [Verrucomicrobiae bacterium]|nr:choice-of-anchor tandem repeat GloVer-containing protein [Verrucomicrobiae bacterium]
MANVFAALPALFAPSRLISLVGLLLLASALPAQKIDVLYNFDGGANGGFPLGGLVRDSKNNLYGTTAGDQGVSAGNGTVFKITSTGQYKTLYQFAGGVDGCYPAASLILDSSGNLYGTTLYGGSGTCSAGNGVVFEITTAGTEVVLHTFTGGTDGSEPEGGLFRDRSGNLYGTTFAGGASSAGTIYEITATGTESVLYNFSGGGDGGNPTSRVVRDASSNLYGTTAYGGSSACTGGCGVVYEYSASGTFTALYSFPGGPEGMYPYGGVTWVDDGTLYGTTSIYGGSGDCAEGCGTVYSVSTTGTEQNVLHDFSGTDGQAPDSGLVLDSHGDLYGTTFQGGVYGYGTVYEVNASGSERPIYNFTGQGDGANPYSGVIRDPKGNIYGTTFEGGAHGFGVVFKITP